MVHPSDTLYIEYHCTIRENFAKNMARLEITKRETKLMEKRFDLPILTYSLIAINVIAWIIAEYYRSKTGFDTVLMWGAKYNLLILAGQYWRFVTPIFLHSGLAHLAINAYSLYILGPDVEKIYGRLKFIIIYLIAGFLGNIASFAFSPHLSVGASSSIFGLLGALLYLGLKHKELARSAFTINIIMMIALNIAYGFYEPRIDNYAHIGGLIGGYLTAFVIGFTGEDTKFNTKKLIALILLIALTVSGILIGFVQPKL